MKWAKEDGDYTAVLKSHVIYGSLGEVDVMRIWCDYGVIMVRMTSKLCHHVAKNVIKNVLMRK